MSGNSDNQSQYSDSQSDSDDYSSTATSPTSVDGEDIVIPNSSTGYSPDSDNQSDFDDNSSTATPVESVEGEEIVISNSLKVYSLDADGCFLPHATKNRPHCDLKEYNKDFFSQFIERRETVHENVVFFVGSARQNELRDLCAIAQESSRANDYAVSDSYFFALKQCIDQLNTSHPSLLRRPIELNPLLLADVAFDRGLGETFEMACQRYGTEWSRFIRPYFNEKKNIKSEVDCRIFSERVNEMRNDMLSKYADNGILLDEQRNKFALLYMQLHHVANQYSTQEIEFNFYDDRLDILTPLFAVFFHCLDLIPDNVTVHFHHYVEGRENTEIKSRPLKGLGLVDNCYRDTIKDMFSDFEVQQVFDGNVQCRVGDPLTHFFDVVHEGEFTESDFLSSTTVVANRPSFLKFNEKRLARLNTPSLRYDFDFECVENSEILELTSGSKSGNRDRLRLTPLRKPTASELVSFFKDKSPLPNKPAALVYPPELLPASPAQ